MKASDLAGLDALLERAASRSDAAAFPPFGTRSGNARGAANLGPVAYSTGYVLNEDTRPDVSLMAGGEVAVVRTTFGMAALIVGPVVQNVGYASAAQRFGSALIGEFYVSGTELWLNVFRGPDVMVWDAIVDLDELGGLT